MRREILLGALAVGTALAVRAFGFALEGQAWPQDTNVVMQLSLGSNNGPLIDGFASFNQSAEDALATWNGQLMHLKFGVVRDSTVSARSGDRQNSAVFSNTIFGDSFSANTLAVTLRLFQRSTLVEADVIFNNAQPFNSYRGPLARAQSGGTLNDLHRIALHEFGHVFGLDHPDQANQNVVAVMNSHQSDIDSLQADDITGGQYLYGAAPPTATPSPPPNAADNLVNISTRAFVGTGERVLIGGFIVQGAPPAAFVIRAIGPSLAGNGVAGSLSDPVLELRDGAGNLLQSNDNWRDSPDAAAIQSKGLAPGDDHEAALLAHLAAGNYTAIVHGHADQTGVGLAEIYDLQATAARNANISTRAAVLTDDNVMIAGFIVGGDRTKPVVVRALGPSLENFGISSPLADPTLELRDSNGNLLTSNDDWRDGPDAALIQSEGLAPSHDYEATLQQTVNPGNYTAIVRGFNNGTGVALVEVYDLSPPPNQ